MRYIQAIAWWVIAGVSVSNTYSLAAQTIDHQLCIRNFQKIALSDTDADDILARASAILRQVGDATTQCKGVQLSRKESVRPFDQSEMPRTLSLESDFPKFTNDPCVKVVERITWCGGIIGNGEALGCAPVPGQGIVVVRRILGLTANFNHDVEPITWLHEFGHTRGLPHNLQDSRAVMAPGLGPNNLAINVNECQVYANVILTDGAALQASVPMPVGSITRLAQAEAQSAQIAGKARVPVEDFVKQTFLHNSPVEVLKQYAGGVTVQRWKACSSIPDTRNTGRTSSPSWV